MQIWAIFCHHSKLWSSWFRHCSPHWMRRRSWGQGLMACPGRSACLICWCLCQYPGPTGPYLGRRLNSCKEESINSDLFKNYAKKDSEKFEYICRVTYLSSCLWPLIFSSSSLMSLSLTYEFLVEPLMNDFGLDIDVFGFSFSTSNFFSRWLFGYVFFECWFTVS